MGICKGIGTVFLRGSAAVWKTALAATEVVALFSWKFKRRILPS